MATEYSLLDPAMRPLLDQAGLQAYHDFIRCLAGEVVGQSGTTLTRRLDLAANGRREVVYLKRYHYVGSRWRHRFRLHKGWVEARNYALLRDRCGLAVPEVIAFGSRRRGLRLLDAFLLTRAVEGAVPLDEFVLGHPDKAISHQPSAIGDAPTAYSALSHSDALALLCDLARTVAKMHAADFFHWDLQWRNILVRSKAPASNPQSAISKSRLGDRNPQSEVFLIDSSRGGLRRTPPGRAHGRIRDLFCLDKLARQHLSRTMRLRFLRAYLGRDAGPRQTRRLIRSLIGYVERKSR